MDSHGRARGASPDALAERLGRLIAHPTIASTDAGATDPGPFEALHATLAELYPLLHERCELTRVGAHGLLFRWPGTDAAAQPLLLMAHQDVVPVTGQDWTSDPFTPVVRDGKLVGRGALDDKGMLLTIAEAVEDPERTWLDPAVDLSPGAEACARMLFDVLRRVHRRT